MGNLISQNRHEPARMHDAICRLMRRQHKSLKICVAYVTKGGVELLSSAGEQELGTALWNDVDKQIVTSLDYGITSPAGLRTLKSIPNSHLRIANADVIGRIGMRPEFAFHSKGFCTHEDTSGVILAGSSNLTRSALTTNTEMAIISEEERIVVEFLESFSRLDEFVHVDDELIDRYEKVRSKAPRFEDFDDPPENQVVPSEPPAFSEFASRSGQQLPARFWIEAGSMSSSGSRHQLELPRHGNRFFGFNFDNYGNQQQEEIGTITLIRGSKSWADQRIVWHGDNGMERLYLPTQARGGVPYVDTAILFEKSADDPTAYVFTVTPWESSLALSWRNASIAAGAVFRVPLNPRIDGRICGLLP